LKRPVRGKMKSDKINKILKLPCGHVSIQIKDKAEDQYIICPKCMKKFLLVWSLNPKIKWRE